LEKISFSRSVSTPDDARNVTTSLGWAVAGPLCARIRVGQGLERRQAGQAEVHCASWSGQPAHRKKMRKGKEK
jgi:hypothetical protein